MSCPITFLSLSLFLSPSLSFSICPLFPAVSAERVFACSVVTLDCLLLVARLPFSPLSLSHFSAFFWVLMQRVETSCRTRLLPLLLYLLLPLLLPLPAIWCIYCAFILSTFRWPYENKFKWFIYEYLIYLIFSVCFYFFFNVIFLLCLTRLLHDVCVWQFYCICALVSYIAHSIRYHMFAPKFFIPCRGQERQRLQHKKGMSASHTG